MIRCIAIDDEPLALELLEDNISKLPFLELKGSFDNPIDAFNMLQDQAVDLVFLDIQMPGLTGLQLIKSLTHKPLFILITAYEKYALQGFDLDVTDYLVKPVPLDRFIKACNKAKEVIDLKSERKDAGALPPPSYFFVNVDYSLLKINFNDIKYVEGLKDYLKIHLASSAKPIIPRMSMKAIEDALPASRFVRVHKSYIVSVDHVTAARKNSVFIGTTEIPVSESYPDAMPLITGRQGTL